MANMIGVPSQTDLVRSSMLRSLNFFVSDAHVKPSILGSANKSKLLVKFNDEYSNLDKVDLSAASSLQQQQQTRALENGTPNAALPSPALDGVGGGPGAYKVDSTGGMLRDAQRIPGIPEASSLTATFQLAVLKNKASSSDVSSAGLSLQEPAQAGIIHPNAPGGSRGTSAAATELSHLTIRKQVVPPKPIWHPPWKLQRVISGHQGWVQCLAVDTTNEWLASGGNDRLIKIWDLATGSLKLSLTGHINTVRGLCISARHPYMFSCGEDNRVKCWDLEQNKVVRDYHGHLSGVYCVALHPALDILCSGGRDAVVRVWDMRTKTAIHVLEGHRGTVTSLQCQSLDPQIISGSQDKMVRLWDLAAGKCSTVLTHHKKSIRAIVTNPREYSFCSCAADSIKVWQCPEGKLDRNIEGQNAILNCAALKDDGEASLLVAGSNNGQLHFWDWPSGCIFQTIQSRVQPGSLESENGIFACAFDKSETRLITGECDKTIKVWREDEQAMPPDSGDGGSS